MRGMIVAAQPEAAEAGAAMLRRGGNAMDALIACAFSQGVVDPQMCSIGGFGAMQVYMPKHGVHQVLEFFGRAPLSATPDMWADKFIGQSRDGFAFLLADQSNDIGYGAVATPGNLKGYTEALSRFGTMALADVMQPAIEQAKHGFMVRPYVHYYWSLEHTNGEVDTADKLRFSETGRKIYFRPDGKLKRPGDTVANEDLARTLERIALAGPDIFYRGEIAQEIAADMEESGGLVSTADLAAYQVKTREPVWGSYRGHRIAANPPPAGGGSLVELLHILEHFDLAELGHNSVEHLRILAEAMKWMTIDKDAYMGDPDFVDIPLERLLSPAYSAELAERIRRGDKADVPRAPEPQMEPQDTTVACVADEEGNVVSLTHTLGIPSGAITPGLGFMYNGAMNGFDPRPGRANSIVPGKARGSALVPTIVFRDDSPRLVFAAPGGTYIVPAVAQALMNVIDFGMSMFEAVAAPRIVALSDTIDVSNRISYASTEALEGMGYMVARSYQGYAFGAAHGIEIKADGWSGGADPQRDGVALAV